MKWIKINESFDYETDKKAYDIKHILEGIIEGIEVCRDSSYDMDWYGVLRKLNKAIQQVTILANQQDKDFDN